MARYLIAKIPLVILILACFLMPNFNAEYPNDLGLVDIVFKDKADDWKKEHFVQKQNRGWLIKIWESGDPYSLFFHNSGRYTLQAKVTQLEPQCDRHSGNDKVLMTIVDGGLSESYVLRGGTNFSQDIAFNKDGGQLDISLSKTDVECGRVSFSLSKKLDNLTQYLAKLSVLLFLSLSLYFSVYKRNFLFGIMSISLLMVFCIAEKSFGPMTATKYLTIFSCFALLIILIRTVMSSPITNNHIVKASLSLIFSVLLLALVSIPFVELIHQYLFNQPSNPDVWLSIAQSNPKEVYEFLVSTIPVYVTVTFLLFTCLLFYSIFIIKIDLKYSWLPAICFIVSLLCIIFTASSFIATSYSRPAVVYEKYSYELAMYKRERLKRKLNLSQFSATKKGAGETYVVIIGESLNKNHMSLYGYGRDTNPNLRALGNDLYVHKNTYSNHVRTIESLKLALTAANQSNGKSYYEMPSIVELSRAAGFHTTWISNQIELSGNDTPVTLIANGSHNVVRLAKGLGKVFPDTYDSVIFDPLSKALQNRSDNNSIIFLHLYGNHYNYCNRFPKSFTKFKTNFSLRSNKQTVKRINCYDNSVYYNDYFVNKVISMVSKSGGVSSVAYFSDHSDDVKNALYHNVATYSHAMIEIPVMFWFSDEYKDRYIEKIDTLKNNLHRTFTNDYMYDSLLGMLGINSDYYDSSGDLFNAKFTDKKMTMHGSLRITESQSGAK